MNISLKTAQKMAKAGVLDEVAALAEASFFDGVEWMRKRVLSEIESERRTISKGYEATGNEVLTSLTTTVEGIPGSLKNADDIFGDYDSQ